MPQTLGYAAQSADADLAPFSFDRREPGLDEVLIEITHCGVCHSDLHQARNDWKNTAYPCIPGHEIIGTVAAVGASVTRFKAGDTVRVGFKVTEGTRTRVQNYEGVCISRKNGKGIAGSFTVRKISFGEGVERVFPLHSTNIDSITVVRRGRVRRSKLYYLRTRRGKSARIVEQTNYRAPKAS